MQQARKRADGGYTIAFGFRTYTDITPDSFRWTGETLQEDGRTWKIEGEFLAKRQPTP